MTATGRSATPSGDGGTFLSLVFHPLNDRMADTPISERVRTLLEADATDDAAAEVETLRTATADRRQSCLKSLRSTADERPALFAPLAPAFARFLEDDERPVRLTAAKTLVGIARAAPDEGRAAVEQLADRLGDDEEFYYVRARCAEALGYVALAHPETVATPETVADLRVGLSFDEPEVRVKLAKALSCVALGDPRRLRHQVDTLADYLDDEEVLVRYHLCTALAAVGCADPTRLDAAADALTARLDDEEAVVAGRAAEALGLLGVDLPSERLAELRESGPAFAAERAAFALDGSADDGIGSVAGLRETTAAAVEEIRTPDGDGCPNCGLVLPADGPPMCPQCGAPR